jgi:phage terminase small subunit
MAGNHNSGRKPQPTRLKMFKGNPGKRPLNAHEPKAPAGPVVKPEGLSEDASRLWDELAPLCMEMGTLTAVDVQAFAALCELQATFKAIIATKATEQFNPRLERETATALRPFYALFGMDPSSRSRISVSKPVEPESKWAVGL